MSLSRLGTVIFLASLTAQVLGGIQYPISVVNSENYNSLNFTEIFAAYGDDMSNEMWARTAWNGLTTFARAAPLRCFGVDAGAGYDVAIVGAPFDTATSFRPG